MIISMRILFVLLISSFFISSCGLVDGCGSDKVTYLSNFETFIEEVVAESKKGELSETQWASYDEQLDNLTGKCQEKFEKEFSTADEITIAGYAATYLYARYGMLAVMQLSKQTEGLRKALDKVDFSVLLNMATKIVQNPDEITKIMDDLRARYGD